MPKAKGRAECAPEVGGKKRPQQRARQAARDGLRRLAPGSSAAHGEGLGA